MVHVMKWTRAQRAAALERWADRVAPGDLVEADSVRRAREGEAIAESYRQMPQGRDEDAAALANSIAMTEAEPS